MNEFKKDLITAIETVCDAYKEEEPTPVFNIGNWVIGVRNCYPKTPAKIISFIGNGYQFVYDDFTGAGQKCNHYQADDGDTYIRLTTKEEIESHLRKIADEKYRGKHFRAMNDLNNIHTITGTYWYCDPDELHSVSPRREWGNGNSDPTIYSNGEWAEIVPEKKKLPKTREAFNKFILEYEQFKENMNREGRAWSNYTFLDQYEN